MSPRKAQSDTHESEDTGEAAIFVGQTDKMRSPFSLQPDRVKGGSYTYLRDLQGARRGACSIAGFLCWVEMEVQGRLDGTGGGCVNGPTLDLLSLLATIGAILRHREAIWKRILGLAIALVFPGQGSQAVGMGQALAEAFPPAKAVFDEVDDALSQNLSQIIWGGPKDELTLTENAQPALMAMSMAVMRVLETEYGFSLKDKIKFVAGHSLGEYSALAAAGSFSLADTARLLKLRGQAMQAAVPVGEGGMAALLGVGLDVAQKVADEAAQGDVCQVANDNEPTQVVLSGSKSAIDRVIEISKSHGVRRALPLPVSAPFHCALMQPAAEAMAHALGEVKIEDAAVPVIANVLAQPITEPDEIRKRLVEQVTGTVRWREGVSYMTANGISDIYEIGSGKVLAGLVKRIEKSLNATSIGAPDDFEAARGGLIE